MTGITTSDLGDSHRAAAIEVVISPEATRWLTRLGDNHIVLDIHRCGKPEVRYPAAAFLDGNLFTSRSSAVAANSGTPTTLTFFLPEQVQDRGRFDCAALDARGMVSLIYLRSQVLRLPSNLQFRTPERR